MKSESDTMIDANPKSVLIYLLIISAILVLSSAATEEKAFSRKQRNQETFDKFDWGSIWTVDYLGQRYFAAYASGLLYDFSKDRDLTKNDQLSSILLVNTTEMTITSGTPLNLEEGYELAIRSVDVDGNKAYVELSKEGEVVDSAVITSILPDLPDEGLRMKSPEEETLVYKINKHKPNETAIVSVHFANVFRGSDQNLATVDKIRQVSETDPSKVIFEDDSRKTLTGGTPLKLKEGYEMILKSIDIDGIKMYVELTREDAINGSVTVLSRVIRAPADVSDTYSYSVITDGSKEREILSVHFASCLRGADQNLATVDKIRQVSGTDPTKVINEDSNEMILASGTPLKLKEGYELGFKSIDVKGDKILVELEKSGVVVDSAVVMPKNALPDTYSYGVNRSGSRYRELISVHFKNSLRGVDQELVTIDRVWQASENQPSLIYYDDTAKIITPGSPLKLEDGYELAVDVMDLDGNRVFMILTRNGDLVDAAIIEPKNDEPEDYTYALDIGEGRKIEILSVHFKNAFCSADRIVATADHIWQVSPSRLSQALIDEDGKWMLDTSAPLQLEEGYALALKALHLDSDRACLELYKDGVLVDTALVVLPLAKAADKTYAYQRDLGATKGIVVIAVHFKNVFRGADQNLATVDGLWQISDTPIEIV